MEDSLPTHDVIVIGASAGGVEALLQVVRELPEDLPASVFIVLHLPAQGPNLLPRLLRRTGRLKVAVAEEGMSIEYGTIYLAARDRHLLLRNGSIRLYHGAKENGMRPAVDPLFRSAARVYGSRVVGVILSGSLDDGTMGLAAIKGRGGAAVVQDPDEALFHGMPASAVENVDVDFVLPVNDIASKVVELAHTESRQLREVYMSEDMEQESDIEEPALAGMADQEPGEPSIFTCPECHGTLWTVEEGSLVHYRCRVGHAYSIKTLLAGQEEALEAGLWAAMRALQERRSLTEKMAQRALDRGQSAVAERFTVQAKEAQAQSELVREVIESGSRRLLEA